MANSIAANLSRRLYRSLLLSTTTTKKNLTRASISAHFSTNADEDYDVVDAPLSDTETQQPQHEEEEGEEFGSKKKGPSYYDRPLENGLDPGIYKAIVVGQVGQVPIQKKLRGGTSVTLLSVGTGGITNNRRPFQNEDPKEYANRCAVQWHRVSVYPQRLAELIMKHVVPGNILYLEGNLETKIFTDPLTGLVRRIREIAIRRNGRIVFLGKGDYERQTNSSEFKGVGYY